MSDMFRADAVELLCWKGCGIAFLVFCAHLYVDADPRKCTAVFLASFMFGVCGFVKFLCRLP